MTCTDGIVVSIQSKSCVCESQAFAALDTTGTGFITVAQLESVVVSLGNSEGHVPTTIELKAMLKVESDQLDVDGFLLAMVCC